MLYWAAIVFVATIVAAVLGFGALSGFWAGFATNIFWLLSILFVLFLMAGLFTEKHPNAPHM